MDKKAFANERLRYGISVLRGKSGLIATKKGVLEVVLVLKRALENDGFWWQAKILDAWIHRWQRGDFEK